MNEFDAPPQWGGIGPPEPAFAWKQLSTIPIRPITWVDYPFLQGSAFHLLAGVKNSGKGTWLANIAARCTRGDFSPSGWPQRVLWISAGEDSYAVDVRPRVEAAGGDSAGVLALDGYGFVLPTHAQELSDKVREAEAALVIIDPLGGVTMGSSSDDWNVRPALSSLNHLADETGTMVFGVRHISNKTRKHSDGILSGILGSSDWVNIPRAILALIHDDVDPAVRHLFAVTSNRGPSDTPGMMFRIEGQQVEGQADVAVARVLGESYKDPEELMVAKRQRHTSRSDAAESIVLALLNETPGGAMESDQLDAEVARRTGLAAKTVRNVRSEMAKRGLVKPWPEKDELGSVLRWLITITNAGIAHANPDALQTPVVPVAPASPTSFIEQRARAGGFDPSSGSGDLQGETHIPSQIPRDLGSGIVSTNGHDPHHNLQLGFGLNSPDPAENPDPEDPEISGSGAGKPFSMSVQPIVPADAPAWERAWHERRKGGS